MACLRWTVQAGPPNVFPITKRITSIGKSPVNDLVLDAAGMIDAHAQIVFEGREFLVSELDPGGLIEVNGKKKRRSRLQHGDRVKLGEVELQFSLLSDASSTGQAGESVQDQHELTGMRRLAEFNRKLAELESVSQELDAFLDAILDVTHAQKGMLILLQEEGKPRIAAARHVRDPAFSPNLDVLSDSILARVIETRRPLVVSDAMNDAVFSRSESVMRLQLSSVMVAPLIFRAQMIGLIHLGNDDVVSLFDDSSLDVLTVFAGQAAVLLHNALVLDELKLDRERLETELENKRFGDLIGSCASVREIYRRVERVAPTDVSVLITGETGTGKELVAREIHRRSNRAMGPFVVVNCGAIPENLLESELFGHTKGAFTGAVASRSGRFQQAEGGTLFLDEIGEMPIHLQVKILRALQERSVQRVGAERPENVDIRIVAATHRDLPQRIADGQFREDLYYRLNVVNLHLPPLRERGEDTVVIARYMLRREADAMRSTIQGFTPDALAAIRAHRWPGNVRQLENRIKKALVLSDGPLVDARDLDLEPGGVEPEWKPLAVAREEFARRYVLEALEKNGGNRTQTAAALGVDPRTIFRYLEREPHDDRGKVDP
jgi:transcriptional regulator with GAF, ATPase, and Fis domain